MVTDEAKILKAANLTKAGFNHGFSTRCGGVSLPPFDTLNFDQTFRGDSLPMDTDERITENLRRFACAAGFPPDRLFQGVQVHGANITIAAGDPQTAAHVETDGWIARSGGEGVRAGCAVAVRTADCVPILLASPDTGSVAALHAGWRGIVAGIVDAGVKLLEHRGNGSKPWAALGPSIGPCCFEVGVDVADLLTAACGDSNVVVDRTATKAYVDLRMVARRQLQTAGIEDARIEDVGGCTACDPSLFFSHRRDGLRRGCHLSVIVARN